MHGTNINNNKSEWPKKLTFLKIPLIYGSTLVPDELREMLHELNGYGITYNFIPKCVLRILASKACKSAVRFGDYLNKYDMQKIISELSDCNKPFQCAHGRPTMFPILNLNINNCIVPDI